MEIKDYPKVRQTGLHTIWEHLFARVAGDMEVGDQSPFQPFAMWKIVDGKYVRHIKENGQWVPEKKN